MRFWDRRRVDKWLNNPAKSGHANVGGDEIPTKLATEPIIGRRVWRVATDRHAGLLALQSIHVSLAWDNQMTAECRSEGYKYGHGGHDDPAPSLECACGLYAQLPDQVIHDWWFSIGGKVYASGDVALSGRVIKCKRGYKAQHAEILPPVFIDVSCSGQGNRCQELVTHIALPETGTTHFYGYCLEHADTEAPLADADVWIRQAASSLSARYGMEVHHWR